MSAPSVRAELAATIRKVGAEFNRLPEKAQDAVAVQWGQIDDLLNGELLTGDRDRAFAAIETWRNAHLELFKEATK
jgi:hypothetical protein